MTVAALNTTFAEALLARVDDEFEGAPGASRAAAVELMRAVVAWLDANPLPDDSPEGGWAQWIRERSAPFQLPDALADLLDGVQESIEPDVDLGRYLGQVAPLARDRAQTQGAGVRFMSMVSSKGLTVQACITVGVEEGIIPHPQADMEEERRLLYVAMTRARKYAYATWARRRKGPTARAGKARVQQHRDVTGFLAHGPVQSQDGDAYMNGRWGQGAKAAG